MSTFGERLRMAKKKKAKNNKKASRHLQISSQVVQPNILNEAIYIIKRAQEYDSRIVILGSLVFFSTDTGDAWILDPEDSLALCLARDGDKQSYSIAETSAGFTIEWNADYQIDGNAFIVLERSGRMRTIIGYPVVEILQAIERTQLSAG
jgi:hypothetical protein